MFGEQRRVAQRYGAPERALYALMGVVDPAHYLHFSYLERALDSIANFRPRQILDAGCGRGDYSFYLARRYPEAAVLGVDLDEAAIAENRDTAQRLGLTNVRFEVADLVQLDPTPRFDFILSIDVLEHIREQNTALKKLASALRPGGYSFFHVPTVRERPVPFSRRLTDFHNWAIEEHVAEELTADAFRSAVAKSGVELVASHRTFGYFTGELATSLFALPYRRSTFNRVLQASLAPLCRALVLLDRVDPSKTRYAVATLARKPAESLEPQRMAALNS